MTKVEALCDKGTTLVPDLQWVLENSESSRDNADNLVSACLSLLAKMAFAATNVRNALRKGRTMSFLTTMLCSSNEPAGMVTNAVLNFTFWGILAQLHPRIGALSFLIRIEYRSFYRLPL